MLTVIAEIRTRLASTIAGRSLINSQKLSRLCCRKRVAMAMRRGLTMPQASVSDERTRLHYHGGKLGERGAFRSASANATYESPSEAVKGDVLETHIRILEQGV